MKTIIYTLLFAMLAPLWLSNCKDKSNNPEPQPRGNYWSKMTCKVDGKDWGDCKPSGLGGNTSRTSAEWFKNYEGQPLKIYGTNFCETKYTEISISIYNFKGEGIYWSDINNVFYYDYLNPWQPSQIGFKTNGEHKGEITITKFDTIKKELYGTFEFEAINADSPNVKRITEGHFSKIIYITN